MPDQRNQPDGGLFLKCTMCAADAGVAAGVDEHGDCYCDRCLVERYGEEVARAHLALAMVRTVVTEALCHVSPDDILEELEVAVAERERAGLATLPTYRRLEERRYRHKMVGLEGAR